MKVRWTHESVRLRITPTELNAMLNNEIISETISLGRSTWSARVISGCARTDYSLIDGALIIFLSLGDRSLRAHPETEGIYIQPTAEIPVRLIIEKDFPCEHPRPSKAEEPQTETFEAPCKPASQAS